MAEQTSLADLKAHLAEVEARQKDLSDQFHDRDFSPEAEAEWDAILAEHSETKERIAKREKREADLLRIAAQSGENGESERTYAFQVKKQSVVPDDPTKIEEYRVRARSLDELEQGYRDGARHLLERYRPSHPLVSSEEAQHDIDTLIDRDNEVAIRMIATSSSRYAKEFETYIKTQGNVVGPEMLRTASLTTTAGGYAVPVELDTTLILTNAGVVNPIRQVARVRQTNVNTVEFINTTGVTAGFGAEAAESTDGAPVLAQPTVNIEKAFAFVPMSIEIAEDWAGIQQDMALLFADAKNQLESNKYLLGLGHTSNQPQGLIAVGGATAVISSATTAVLAIADLYSLENALSPRYRDRAVVFGNRAAFQKVRQFATAAGPSAWTDSLRVGNPNTLLGYPALEWSNMVATMTTSGSTVLTIGDPNYFAIVDRIGLNVEYIPHLFGSGTRYPTGQRGLYAYWRTSSQVLSPTLQANSAFVSLKLL